MTTIPIYDSVSKTWKINGITASGFYSNGVFLGGNKTTSNTVVSATDNSLFYYYNTTIPTRASGFYSSGFYNNGVLSSVSAVGLALDIRNTHYYYTPTSTPTIANGIYTNLTGKGVYARGTKLSTTVTLPATSVNQSNLYFVLSSGNPVLAGDVAVGTGKWFTPTSDRDEDLTVSRDPVSIGLYSNGIYNKGNKVNFIDTVDYRYLGSHRTPSLTIANQNIHSLEVISITESDVNVEDGSFTFIVSADPLIDLQITPSELPWWIDTGTIEIQPLHITALNSTTSSVRVTGLSADPIFVQDFIFTLATGITSISSVSFTGYTSYGYDPNDTNYSEPTKYLLDGTYGNTQKWTPPITSVIYKAQDSGKLVWYQQGKVQPAPIGFYYNTSVILPDPNDNLKYLVADHPHDYQDAQYLCPNCYVVNSTSFSNLSTAPVTIPTKAINSDRYFTFQSRVDLPTNFSSVLDNNNGLLNPQPDYYWRGIPNGLPNSSSLFGEGMKFCEGYYSSTNTFYIWGKVVSPSASNLPYDRIVDMYDWPAGYFSMASLATLTWGQTSAVAIAWNDGMVALDMSNLPKTEIQTNISDFTFYMKDGNTIKPANGVLYDITHLIEARAEKIQVDETTMPTKVMFYENGKVSTPVNKINLFSRRRHGTTDAYNPSQGAIIYSNMRHSSIENVYRGPNNKWYTWPTTGTLAVTGHPYFENGDVTYVKILSSNNQLGKQHYVGIEFNNSRAGVYGNNVVYVQDPIYHTFTKLVTNYTSSDPILNVSDNLLYTSLNGTLSAYSTRTPFITALHEPGQPPYKIDIFGRYYICTRGTLSLANGKLSNITYRNGVII